MSRSCPGPCPPATCSRPPGNPGRCTRCPCSPAFLVPGQSRPRESGPGGPPPACTMRTSSPPAAGRACGPDLHQARRRLSAAPQRRRHPPGQSCRVLAPRWHADASRHQRIRPARAPVPGAAGGRVLRRWMIRLRMSDGGTRPHCCYRAAMRIRIGRGGSEASGEGRRISWIAGLPGYQGPDPAGGDGSGGRFGRCA